MTDIDQELAEYGLDREKYEECLSDIRDKVNGCNDLEWEEIVENYNLDMHYDTLRKASRTIFGGAFVTQYLREKYFGDRDANESYLTVLRREKDEVRKERMKLATEKNQYAQLLREKARDELICEKIVDAVKQLPKFVFPDPIICEQANTREGILAFGDEHYGTEFCIKGLFGETINEYSPEILNKECVNCYRKQLQLFKKKTFPIFTYMKWVIFATAFFALAS